MTNAEKFKKIFGFEMRQSICPFEGVDVKSRCGDCEWIVYADCCKKFWQSEYQGEPTIPLPVIEDIKAEIEKSKYIDKDTRLVENANSSGLSIALDIIDKAVKECEA